MKVILVLGSTLRFLPWAPFYLDKLLHLGCDITVITWNREGMDEIEIDNRIHMHQLNLPLDNSIKKFKKISSYLKFRKFVISEIKKNDYDLMIVSMAQTSLCIYDILQKQYQNKYIYDMRDPSFEKIPVLSMMLKKIVRNSSIVFISSEGYRCLLPTNVRIVTNHNYREKDKEIYKKMSHTAESDRIRISFWGFIRDIEVNKIFIERIANDDRFILNYYGALWGEAEKLFSFCKEHKIENVSYCGTYGENGRIDIATRTDLILNLYANDNNGENPRMTNKYYDGVMFNIPQIVYDGGYMSKLVKKKSIGFSTNLSDDTADRLYDYYRGIDKKIFYENCKAELRRIEEEQKYAKKCLEETIREKDIYGSLKR